MALTKALITGFEYEGTKGNADYRWDSEYGKGGESNFGVRVYPSGYKSFFIHYRLEGDTKARWYTIGSCARWSHQEAREEAHRLLRRARQGLDPKTPDNIKSLMTLTEFSEVFLADMQARNKATLSEMRRRIEKRLTPAFGN